MSTGRIVAICIFGLGMIIEISAWTFKILHWPLANQGLMLGAATLILGILVFLIDLIIQRK